MSLDTMKGVIPALLTPFGEDESLDEARLRTLVSYLIDTGVHGLYLTGSTGEGFLMTSQERKRVVEIVCDETRGRLPIIAHIGAIGTRKSVELAEHAQEHGVDAISSVPPFYWNFDADSIFSYYQDITASTDLPMIIYNIALAGLVGYDQILRLAQIDGVKGIKYTATDHHQIMKLKEDLGQSFAVYSGCDEMAISGLSFGADGIIGSFYNIIPELFLQIYNAVVAGDLESAVENQRKANLLILYAGRYQYLSIIKRGLARMGIDAGYCRKPFQNYCEEELERLFSDIKGLCSDSDIKGVPFFESL